MVSSIWRSKAGICSASSVLTLVSRLPICRSKAFTSPCKRFEFILAALYFSPQQAWMLWVSNDWRSAINAGKLCFQSFQAIQSFEGMFQVNQRAGFVAGQRKDARSRAMLCAWRAVISVPISARRASRCSIWRWLNDRR